MCCATNMQPPCNRFTDTGGNMRQQRYKQNQKTRKQNLTTETICQSENQTQNLLPVREWGFKSLHPHHFRSIAYSPIAGIRALVDNGIRTSLSFPSFRITRVLDALPPRPGDAEIDLAGAAFRA